MRYPHFAAALRQLGTRAELAKMLGIPVRTVSYYLAGRGLPRADKIAQFPTLVEAAAIEGQRPLAAPESRPGQNNSLVIVQVPA